MKPNLHAALVLGVSVLSLPAPTLAQPAPSVRTEREVVLTGAPDEPAREVYAAANFPLTLVFDAPLRQEGLTLAGANVSPHPFSPGTILVTPSAALAERGSVPFTARLADGTSIPLTLVFKPGALDVRVRVVRPCAPSGRLGEELEEARAERQEALRVAASAVLGTREGCTSAGSIKPESVKQGDEDAQGSQVCLTPVFAYVRVKVPKACASPAVRLLRRGEEAVEVLYSEATCTAEEGCHVKLVVRSPAPEAPPDVALELLGKDGKPCGSPHSVRLRPLTR